MVAVALGIVLIGYGVLYYGACLLATPPLSVGLGTIFIPGRWTGKGGKAI